jgi:hypothetical protein
MPCIGSGCSVAVVTVAVVAGGSVAGGSGYYLVVVVVVVSGHNCVDTKLCHVPQCVALAVVPHCQRLPHCHHCHTATLPLPNCHPATHYMTISRSILLQITPFKKHSHCHTATLPHCHCHHCHHTTATATATAATATATATATVPRHPLLPSLSPAPLRHPHWVFIYDFIGFYRIFDDFGPFYMILVHLFMIFDDFGPFFYDFF